MTYCVPRFQDFTGLTFASRATAFRPCSQGHTKQSAQLGCAKEREGKKAEGRAAVEFTDLPDESGIHCSSKLSASHR